MPHTMKAVILTEPGGPEVLKVRDVARPQIQERTDVLIKVQAAGVNPADWQVRKNGAPRYAVDSGSNFTILGIDGVGIVEAVGPDIAHVKPGDEVWYNDGGYAGHFGSYAQYKIVNGHYLAPKPKSLDFIQAAALPTVGLTSWEAVYDKGQVKEGDFVLIHGGAGGLGHISIQLARAKGARVATTVFGAAKEKLVRNLGAELLIDFTTENVLEKVRAWSGKDGADVVFDYVGHANFAKSMQQVAPYGTLVTTVVSDWPSGNTLMAEYKNLEIKFVNIGFPQIEAHHAFRMRQTDVLREVSTLVDAGKLRGHIDHVVNFEGIGESHRALEAGETVGRVVLKIDQ